MNANYRVRLVSDDRGLTFLIEAHNRGAFLQLHRIPPGSPLFRQGLDLDQYCVHRLFIPPVFRRLGMEYLLLDRMARWADRQGAYVRNWISHHETLPGDERSGPEGFYRGFGFAPLDDRDPEIMGRLPVGWPLEPQAAPEAPSRFSAGEEARPRSQGRPLPADPVRPAQALRPVPAGARPARAAQTP